jgi:hypothetical protein
MFGPKITIWDFNKGFAVDILNLLSKLIVSLDNLKIPFPRVVAHSERFWGIHRKAERKSEHIVGNLLIPATRCFVSPIYYSLGSRSRGNDRLLTLNSGFHSMLRYRAKPGLKTLPLGHCPNLSILEYLRLNIENKICLSFKYLCVLQL